MEFQGQKRGSKSRENLTGSVFSASNPNKYPNTHTHTHTHTHKTKSKSQFCDRISTVLRKMGGKKWVKSNQPLAGRTCRNTAGSRRADYTQHMYEIASCIKELEHMKPSRQRAFSLFFFSFYIGWVLRNRIKKGTCGSITSMVNFCFKTHQNARRWISSR
jgi:hypothetical protein